MSACSNPGDESRSPSAPASPTAPEPTDEPSRETLTFEYLDIEESLAALDALATARPELGLEDLRLAPDPELADTLQQHLDPWMLPDDYDHLLRNGGIFIGSHGADASIDLTKIRGDSPGGFRVVFEEYFPEAPWATVSVVWLDVGSSLHDADILAIPLMKVPQESGAIGFTSTQELSSGRLAPSLAALNQGFVIHVEAMGDQLESLDSEALWLDAFREDQALPEFQETPERFDARVRSHQALSDFVAAAPATHPVWTSAPSAFVADPSQYELEDVMVLFGME